MILFKFFAPFLVLLIANSPVRADPSVEHRQASLVLGKVMAMVSLCKTADMNLEVINEYLSEQGLSTDDIKPGGAHYRGVKNAYSQLRNELKTNSQMAICTTADHLYGEDGSKIPGLVKISNS